MSLVTDKVRIVAAKYQVHQIENIRRRRKTPFHAVDGTYRNKSCSIWTLT
jgi:hypothetical protein